MPNSPGLFVADVIFSRSLTVDHTQVPSTQSDFPVLVNFTNATFKTVANGGHVQNANGYDIVFYGDSRKTQKLKWEIERYNASTGELIAWVKVPTLSNSYDTVFNMFYGDPGITSDQSDAINTWSNNFVNVYHLADGVTLNLNDSLNANNGTNHGATPTTGQIDGGANFASASSQYVDCGSTGPFTATTLSAWVNATSFPNAYNAIGVRNNTTTGTDYVLIMVKSTGKLAMYVYASAGVNYDGTGTNTLVAGTTYYLTLTYDSINGLKGYVNAVSDGTASANGSISNNVATEYLGQDPKNTGRFWNGMIDEIHLSSIGRSPDWITCEYNNQKPSSTLVTLGPET